MKNAKTSTLSNVSYIDENGAARNAPEDCLYGVKYVTVADIVYWPLSTDDAKMLRSAECGRGNFSGPTSTPPDAKALIEPEQQPDVHWAPVGWQFYEDGKWWNGDDRIKDHRKNTERAGYLIRDVYAATQPKEQQPSVGVVPEITATFECESNGITGSTAAPIKRIDHHDDGAIEVILDYWPEPSPPDVEVLVTLLEHARCNTCDGSGAFYGGHGQAHQCQWCHDRSIAIAAYRKRVEV